MIRFAFMPDGLRRCASVVLATLGLLALAQPAMIAASPGPGAQDSAEPPGLSHAVVEPIAPSAGRALNAALGRLAKDPRNVDALLEAGSAAIALGDNDAALGFFTRADQVSPGNAKVKLAIAQARLNLNNPVDALRWYADAERLGADPAVFAADRGLAFDLAGDNAAAIAQYRRVVDGTADSPARDEAIRREAVSLAIGGDRRAADLALLPLLQRQDRAAWRAHIFVLAIAGRGDEAVSVAQATMPPDLAASVGPYLRFMVRLTPAQQAAAASLGRFPRAADVGRDDPAVMAYTAAHPRVPLTPAPAPVAALASVAPVAKDARGDRGKRHHAANPAPVLMVAVPVVQPEIALPAPPPPPVTLPAAPPRAAVLAFASPAASTPPAPPVAAPGAPPIVPPASRTVTPPVPFDLAQIARGGTAPVAVAGAAPVHSAPPPAPGVPRPVVLSVLDLPPAPRPVQAAAVHSVVAPAAAVPTAPPVASPVAPAVVPAPVVTSPFTAAAAVAAGQHAVIQPIPAPVVADGQHAVVQPIPGASAQPAEVQTPVEKPSINTATAAKPLATKAAAIKAVAEKRAVEKPATENAVATKAAPDKASRTGPGHATPGKDKAVADADAASVAHTADKTATSKSAKARAGEPKASAKAEQNPDNPKATGKAGRDEALKRALAPCKPAAPGKSKSKSQTGKVARASTKASDARGKAARGGKSRKAGKTDVTDSETCDSTTQGDRPDAPGGVSRDSDSPLDSKAADSKGKTKAGANAKGHGKNADKDAKAAEAKAAEKDTETTKPGRHARYASRIWVQVLTAGDRDKIPGEWRNLVRKAHALKGRKPYLTPWRSNYRLLTGPFDSDADAQDFIAELRKDGVSGFEWTSPAGQAVDTMALP